MQRLAVLILALILVTPAMWAGELVGVTMSDTAKVGDTTVHLNGMGLRSKLWVKVYVAGLYLEQKTADPDQVVTSEQDKRVVMHFMTDKATRKKMDGAWQEGFEANSADRVGALQSRLNTFKGYFGDMKDGDEVEIDMTAAGATTVTVNGTKKGTIEGQDFAQALLRVWMGPSPPSDDLKEGMLGS